MLQRNVKFIAIYSKVRKNDIYSPVSHFIFSDQNRLIINESS